MTKTNTFIQTMHAPSPAVAEALRAEAVYGEPIALESGINVILADNAKDYTGPGTNTYLVGEDRLWIIDPGPNDKEHVNAVVKAVADRPVDGIFVTHNHLDHSPAARLLKEAFGAPIYGFENLSAELMALTDEDVDVDFKADNTLSGGETIGSGRWRIDVLHTPGHFPNHLCYLLPELNVLFSGDHVMGWSTTVIVPPLGNLADYLDSLKTMENTGAARLLPSHGKPVDNASARIDQVRKHRMMRHAQIEDCIDRGVTSPQAIVDELYEGLTPRLIEAACGCVQAHLEMMSEMPDAQIYMPNTPQGYGKPTHTG